MVPIVYEWFITAVMLHNVVSLVGRAQSCHTSLLPPFVCDANISFF